VLFCIGVQSKAVDEIVDNNTFFPHLMMATSTHFSYVNVYTPSVSKYKAFGVFMIDYGCVEKSLLLLIIKYWNSIWVNKYVLIKVTCLFPCISPICTSPTWLHAHLSVGKDPETMHN